MHDEGLKAAWIVFLIVVFTIHSRWVNDEQSTMDNGQWTMDNGKWTMNQSRAGTIKASWTWLLLRIGQLRFEYGSIDEE